VASNEVFFPGVADGFLVFVNEFQAIAVTELVVKAKLSIGVA
jgi:hypothetical protein